MASFIGRKVRRSLTWYLAPGGLAQDDSSMGLEDTGYLVVDLNVCVCVCVCVYKCWGTKRAWQHGDLET